MQKKLVVVYTRVSSSSQNLREQRDAAKKVLKARGINEDEVLFLEDFNVSATKNDANNRPAYKKLLKLIKEGRVALVIIYARDRVQRDFYEASEFNEVVNFYGVEVIYTATNEIPFIKNSSIENFYGIFSQQEGKNIGRRTSDATKRYPGKIIGFERIEELLENGSTKVRFSLDNNRSIIIRSLFKEFSQVQTKEEFVSVLTKYGKELNGHRKVMKILQRPFYAGYCLTDYGYDELHHVDEIISLEMFEEVQAILNKFIKEYNETVIRARDKMILNPICGVCNKNMVFKKVLDKPSYFVCSFRHKKVVVELDEFNRIIEETILKETEQFVLKEYESIFKMHLRGVIDNLTYQKQHKEQLLNKSMLLLASNFHTMYEKLKMEIQRTNTEIDEINHEITSVQSLKNELKTISQIVQPSLDNLTKSELEVLIELLIKNVKVHQDYFEIDLYSLIKEKGVV
ncbi:DNA invertase Pin-like site-specific DNA recombinase [Bacillus mesophilus]|uniref:Recombinase family protein n=1 Tax=Bacillus mesophilus TaxID=1808955 RepID=A0A6M0Q9S3_9BACI|nr:recombinase family protein [Bacillus mesophilus]MBM7662261.1 DNA invertase Pin-like site-specific DNA recombinase [Bacillus mesophilus]NEY73102.1 recombinase family protein [Bacillus mesophilus]